MLSLGVKILFCITGIMFVTLLSLRIVFDEKFKTDNKLSPIVAVIGGLLLLYVLCALIIALFYEVYLYKFIMLIFAISPFIIGKLVTYKRLRFFSIFQIICVILSLVFVILV